MRRVVLVFVLVIVALGCDSAPAFDAESVRLRTDRDFERGLLLRPEDDAAHADAVLHAPLLVVEGAEAGGEPPTVVYRRGSDSWTYLWWGGAAGVAQGIHATLDDDGFPVAYEVFRDSAGARLFFVDLEVEQAAAESYGPPLEGRRYSVERPVTEAPRVIVGGVYEPGPTPLGPFVYLWPNGDVNVVLCRCMPPRVVEIVDSVGYRLLPSDGADVPVEFVDWVPVSPGEVLRLAAAEPKPSS